MRLSRSPVIGVTGPDRGGLPAWWMTRLAVLRAGGTPVRITPRRGVNEGRLDALVIGGGADVGGMRAEDAKPQREPRQSAGRRAMGLILAPLVYALRGALSRRSTVKDAARDALELRLLDVAAVRDLPVLGICRGAQLMNLRQGGSLLRNVGTFYTERPELYTTLPRREVHIEAGSLLQRTLRVEHTRVNSLHSHAVDQPGRQLRVVAREPSGVNQAIEHACHRFWVGVQWHPEYLPQLPVQQRLFRALVQACAHPQ